VLARGLEIMKYTLDHLMILMRMKQTAVVVLG
jgi:hypothetical protein